MKRNVLETALGSAVIVIAALFFVYSYNTADVGTEPNSYKVIADFSSVGGLGVGDDVQISGVKIGSVQSVDLNNETFLARVTMLIDSSVKLPTDTAALISSESLLGGLYMALEPGADEEVLEPGGRIEFTQAPQNLEQLLGQFIFSLQDEESE